MSLAHNIRFFRKKQGWGQEALAEKLGYKSYTTIQKWESGVSEPPLKIVHALADLFHISINDLTGAKKSTLAEAGKGAISNMDLTETELDMLQVSRSLNAEGQQKFLEYGVDLQSSGRYAKTVSDDTHNILRVAARDGSYVERNLTQEQAAELEAYLDSLPDIPEGL